MTEPSFLLTPQGRRIAYHKARGTGPGVVFLGGFRSDMGGTKALHLQDWASASGRSFFRFDYSGHGQSYGAFEDGAIGDWLQDAIAVLALTDGPQVLVGSSMGGWIALLLAQACPERVAGLVGIAAAPDFTEDSMWAGFSKAQRAALLKDGRVTVPSGYAADGYVITRRLIEEGRDRLVLRRPLYLPFPVRLLHGAADADVPVSVALRLMDHANSPDMRLMIVKGADHRFSTPKCLKMISDAVGQVFRND